MLLIFAASSQPKGALPDFGALDWNIKKAGHLLVYGALALAYLHGLAAGRRPAARQAALAVLLAIAYGMTDEYHQSFVLGRAATWVDVGIDGIGALAAAVARQWIEWAARRPLNG